MAHPNCAWTYESCPSAPEKLKKLCKYCTHFKQGLHYQGRVSLEWGDNTHNIYCAKDKTIKHWLDQCKGCNLKPPFYEPNNCKYMRVVCFCHFCQEKSLIAENHFYNSSKEGEIFECYICHRKFKTVNLGPLPAIWKDDYGICEIDNSNTWSDNSCKNGNIYPNDLAISKMWRNN